MAIVKKSKEPIKLTSEQIKIALISLYRFEKRFEYVCTEFEFADITASDSKKLIEIEVKISLADLKNESKKSTKIRKHQLNNLDGKPRKSEHIPNEFYFAMPYELAQKKEVIDYITSLNDKYGIITVTPIYSKYHKKYVYDIRYYKRAKKLHDNKITRELLDKIVKRLSSENIGLREKLYYIKNPIK